MRLWSIQLSSVYRQLQQRGRYRARWRHVDSWKLSYVWMAREMVRRGFCARPVAPIWAWHSCDALHHPPTLETIGDLFGFRGITVVMLEIEVPDRLVLLSHYGIWNDIMAEIVDCGTETPSASTLRRWEEVFCLHDMVSWADEGNHYDIQACIPYLDRRWVRDVKWVYVPLSTGLKPDPSVEAVWL